MWDERECERHFPGARSPAREAWQALRRRAVRDPLRVPEQVINARRRTLAGPGSEVDAERVRAGWAATLPGLEPPLIWEREARRDAGSRYYR